MTLREKLTQSGLSRVAKELELATLEATRLITQPADEGSLSLGVTKIGGEPDLPSGTLWPTWKDSPLSFIAQLNLEELHHISKTPLPPSGLLSFFYDAEQKTWGFDPEDLGSWRVIYSSDLSSLRRFKFPAALTSNAHYDSCKVDFLKTSTLAPYESRVVERLHLSVEEADDYGDIWVETQQELEGPRHQVLGHPHPIQGEMQLECQLVSHGIYCGDSDGYNDPRSAALEKGADDWQLLLQIDSDDNAGMMWGDTGMLYFWIQKQALERQEFHKVWVVLQCG
jgi:uncharacterized protein YwqG